MQETKRFSIGVPKEWYAWLQQQAKHNHRSMNGQINKMIEEAIKKQEETQQKAA